MSSRLFLITDTHFGHSMMLEMKWRPENYEKRLHSSIMQEARTEDVLIHLGDVSQGDDAGMQRVHL